MKIKEEVNPGEKIEFDIIVGGKYKERASQGILIGLNNNDVAQIAMSCSVLGLMSAYYALKEYVEKNEECVKLMAEYEKFKEAALPEIEKLADELRVKLGEDLERRAN